MWPPGPSSSSTLTFVVSSSSSRPWGVRMSIVSDNWTGLEATFAGLDIQHYFEGFAISEILGCRKPDPTDVRRG